MLTLSLAKDLAPDVRVNGVAPGALLWPEDEMTDATKQSILEQIPMGRAGDPKTACSRPEDRAALLGFVRWLVRDAGYVTGQIIAIDGGRSIGW